MWNHERLRFTFIVLNFITFLTHGFVIEKRFIDKERYSNPHPLPNYDDYDEALANYYNENTADGHNYKKRDFSPDKLRQQVRERMESIVQGRDNFLDDEMDREDNILNSVLRKMMTEKQEAMKGAGNLKMSGRYMEEKSTQTKIESDGDKGVAMVTGQTMESSSSGNGSSPVMKVAKVVAVATKDGKENGEWKMKPLQEEVKVMTPSPEDAKEKDEDGDKEVERLKSLFQQRRGFNGRDNLAKLFERGDDNDYYDNHVGHDNDHRNQRRKRSISYEELEDLKNNLESPKDGKSVKDVDLLKNYIALQDAENRHLMQALDLASEIELSNEGDADGDPKTINEQMYHMRKALEDERALSVLRKQIQLSIKNSAAKRSPYIPDRSLYDGKNVGFRDDRDYDDDIDYGDLFLERYVRRNEGGDEEEEEDDDDGRYAGVQEDDANLMEDWADDITLDRHKLRNEEIIDRLREMMSQSDEGWKGESRSKKLHPPPELKNDELLDEVSLRNLLRAYRKHYKPLEDDADYPLIFPNDEEDYDVGGDDNDIDPDMRRKILENLARKSFSEYQLNPFFRNITKMGSSEKRFFEENRPMVSSDDDVENTEPWCPKAAKLVDNCLYARLNGLLPDSEAVDLCNAHQLCYKCGSSNGVTSDECDRAFMERSKELCLNEMACKKQAASLYVTMMADRKFYSEMEAPDICTDSCVTSILYTDRSD